MVIEIPDTLGVFMVDSAQLLGKRKKNNTKADLERLIRIGRREVE